MKLEKKKIVILGGGYAGLMTAVTLQKKVHHSRAEIILINKNDYHYFTTKVHEAGAGTIDPDAIKLPIRELINPEMVTFIQDEVVKLDPIARQITCKHQIVAYDFVVVSVGGSPKTYNIPGVSENAFFLFDWAGTVKLHEHLEEQFKEYNRHPTGEMNIVIAGTGFTGMEFIHELRESIPIFCQQQGVDELDVHVIVVEPNQEILKGYPEEIVIDAEKSLLNQNCELKIGVAVARVEKDKVVLDDNTVIPTKTFIWAGGVQGHPLLEGLGFELLDGRVKLNDYCEVPGFPEVYVLGDASVSFNEKGEPYPPTAQIAIQEGQYCAYNIAMKIYGQPAKPFHYIYRGMVLALGKGNASGIVYNHHVNGHFGSFMKWVIEMRYYFMLGGFSLVRKFLKKQ